VTFYKKNSNLFILSVAEGFSRKLLGPLRFVARFRNKVLFVFSKASSLRSPLVLFFVSPAVGGLFHYSPPPFFILPLSCSLALWSLGGESAGFLSLAFRRARFYSGAREKLLTNSKVRLLARSLGHKFFLWSGRGRWSRPKFIDYF
jgi:hypothetical protein